MQHGAGDDPDRQRGHPVGRREECGRDDDGPVVEERRHRLGEEALIGGQDPDDHPAGTQEDRLQQEDPGEPDDDLVIVRAVPEGDQRDVERRHDEQQGRAGGQNQDRGVEHPLRNLARPLMLAMGQVLGQHRDKCRADGAGQQEIEEQVRYAEGDAVIVELVVGPEGVRDDQLAHRAQHPTQPIGDQDERRGRRDASPLARHGCHYARRRL